MKGVTVSVIRNSHLRRLAAVIAVSAVVLSVAACSSGTSPNATKKRDTLTWAVASPLGTLDLLTDQIDNTGRQLLLGNVVQTLTRQTMKNGKANWVPSLATAWKQVDASTWEFTLRKGVKFQDGTAFGADDVAYSIDQVALATSVKDSTLNVITGAKAVNDNTVDVTFNVAEPFGYRVLSTVPIMPSGWENDKAKTQSTAIGTGPYKLQSVSSGRDTATLVKWSGYWGKDTTKLTKVVMRVIPDNGARLAALKSGEIDVAFNLSPELNKAAPKVLTAESTEVEIIRINALPGAVFSDLKARQAINYAVDDASLVKDVRDGFGVAAHGQPVPAQVTGYVAGLKGYPFNLKKATKMISDEGLTGKTVSMMCATDQYGAVGVDSCQAIAADIQATGLKVALQLLPAAQWLQQGYLAKQNSLTPPDLFYISAGSSTFDAGPVLTNYFICGPKATICDPSLEASAQKALNEPNAAQKTKDFQATIQLASEKAALIPTVNPQNFAAVRADVDGTLYGDQTQLYWDEWSVGNSK
jgi:peptide/nickel transport system substrate-binding protein